MAGRVLLHDLVTTSAEVASTRSRKAKVVALAALLSRTRAEEVGLVVSYLGGRLLQRRTGVGWRSLTSLPAPADEPILELDNVIVAPHSLCWTDQCFGGIGAADVAATLAVMKGEVPRGIVNKEIVDRPGWQAKLAGYRKG